MFADIKRGDVVGHHSDFDVVGRRHLKLKPLFPPAPGQADENNMDMPNEMPVIQHKEVEAWECVICYEGGKKTGQITIACGHTICLGCYTCEAKRVAGLGQELKCPYCRRPIRLTEGPTAEEQDRLNKHIRVIQLDNHRLAGLQKQMEEIQKQVDERKEKVLKLAEAVGADVAQVQAEVLLLHAPAMPAAPQAAAAAPPAAAARFQEPVPPIPPPHVPMDHPENGTRCPGCRIHRPNDEIRYRHMPMVEADGINDRRLKRCGRCLEVQRRTAIIWRNAH